MLTTFIRIQSSKFYLLWTLASADCCTSNSQIFVFYLSLINLGKYVFLWVNFNDNLKTKFLIRFNLFIQNYIQRFLQPRIKSVTLKLKKGKSCLVKTNKYKILKLEQIYPYKLNLIGFTYIRKIVFTSSQLLHAFNQSQFY